MLRIRLLAALAGALIAGLAVATIASGEGFDDDGPPARDHAFGVGTFGPGCWQTHAGPFCVTFNYTIRLLGVQQGHGHRAWGILERRNNVTGGIIKGTVTCMNVSGNRASIGGVLASTSAFPGDPFVIYVEDNRTLGTPIHDQISALAALPADDPDRPLMPARFPYVCPSPESIYGYLPLTSGDVTVTENAVGPDEDD